MDEKNYIQQSDWIDLKTAEKEFPFSKRTLWDLIANGRLPSYRPLPKKVLVKRPDLNKLIESSRVGADLDQTVDDITAGLGQGE